VGPRPLLGPTGAIEAIFFCSGLQQPHLELADADYRAIAVKTAFARHRTIDDDRYPLSPRVQTLKAILAKIQPKPTQEALPPPKRYAPPSATTTRRPR
jgi:hypothetical protein